MDDEAWRAFEPFRQFTGPNQSNATRHRIIDDLLRAQLTATPNRQIVIIGAGFDSRAFRLRGGNGSRWTSRRCSRGRSRACQPSMPESADPARRGLLDRALFYLGEHRIRELLRTMRAHFPQGEVLCDVMTVDFFNAYSQPIHKQIVELGASFELPAHPIADIFASEGYVPTARISTTKRAAELGQMPWFMRALLYMSRQFVDGYSIRVFRPG